MVYHRFQEAKELLTIAGNDLDQFCTEQVITRCIDLRNYKPGLERNFLRNLPLRDSFYAALEGGNVILDQSKVVQEANDIFETLLPFAINKKSVMTRAFNSAVFHLDFILMERFVNMDQDLFGSDDEGLTPLMTAVKFHRRSSLQWLLSKGADIHYINSRGENLLHILARVTLNDVVINSIVTNLVFEEGLNCKLANNQGWTPLDIAKKCENYEIADLILMAQHDQDHK